MHYLGSDDSQESQSREILEEVAPLIGYGVSSLPRRPGLRTGTGILFTVAIVFAFFYEAVLPLNLENFAIRRTLFVDVFVVVKLMQQVSLAELDPLAVCIDGSPAAYYVHLSDTNSTLWIVNLESGGWCYSAESCDVRCPSGSMNHLCTSKGQKPDEPLPSGLFQPLHHPDLAEANKVFVPYCTSDAFMGDRFAFGRHFRGTRVVQAVLSDLVQRFGLGHHTAARGVETLIWSGQSAGARGAMVHLDYVKSMLEQEVRDGIEVVGFLDSPLWLDMLPYNSSEFLGFAAMSRSAYSNFGVRHLGADCLAVHGGSPDTAWKCIVGEYRLPFVKTPYFVIASQYDSYQLGKNRIWSMNTPPLKRVYALEFAMRTAIAVRALRAAWPPHAAKQNAVFSWSCYDHASSLGTAGLDNKRCGSNGVTPGEAFRQFLEQRAFSMKKTDLTWVETCEGFACGTGCSGLPALPQPRCPKPGTLERSTFEQSLVRKSCRPIPQNAPHTS